MASVKFEVSSVKWEEGRGEEECEGAGGEFEVSSLKTEGKGRAHSDP
jgi:hypothetical protein